MSALPLALAKWERELATLRPELALALAPWVGRLALALGPWSDARGRGDGEPDGVGALSRRGSYERLLASEWLLADELPDEFLRRAASSEHLFLATVRRAPSGSRRCVALFDAGPSQLGAARIAHLALLIVLARRARDAGARFSWGVLQSAPALRDDSDGGAIRALLDARSTREPSPAQLDAWRDHLAGEQTHEAWAIGGEPMRDELAQRGLRLIAIDDPVAIERRAIEVRIGRRKLELELPEDNVGARLIRDPLRAAAPKPSTDRAPRDGAFGFPGDGRRLVVETPNGFLSWGVPNSPRGRAGSPRRFVLGAGERLVAAGSRGRKLIAVAARDEDLVVYGAFGGPHDSRGRPRFVFPNGLDRLSAPDPPDTSAALRALGSAILRQHGRETVLQWLAGDERLHVLGQDDVAPMIRDHVLAFCPPFGYARGLSYGYTRLVERGEGARVVELAPDGKEHTLRSDPGATPTRALFGDNDALAYDRAPDEWCVLHSGMVTNLSPPSGTKVIGVYADRQSGAALVLLEANERTISLVGRSFSAVVLRSSAPIEHAVASSRGGMVAWRTKEGWIEVGSLHHRAIVMRIAPERDA